ncbi:BgTH12-03300 [Blumeria graminis f. sp. triticale]|uniref:BgTH12-03300 n=1 Tax=Blumeria graminis f. sp. triticale TaxID=1689686 RepID=A0A9W4D3X4_BLUGR|nr:BgTH12-03300 [Blumeria graminis f. sp. triticale]
MEVGWHGRHAEPDGPIKLHQVSRRGYFNKLLKKSNHPSKVRVNCEKVSQCRAPLSPLSPTLYSHCRTSPKDKPLPPIPPSENDERLKSNSQKPDLKPPLKLNRIITPLSIADLYDIFSGAPHFLANTFAQSQHQACPPQPYVAFPWDSQVHVSDLCDHTTVNDPSWACVSSSSLLSVPTNTTRKENSLSDPMSKPRITPLVRELPDMLSLQGLERGTTGFRSALEISVGDSLPTSNNVSSEMISQHRIVLMREKGVLRSLTWATLINRIRSLSEKCHDLPPTLNKSPTELHHELFTNVLYPPIGISDADDPRSLEFQIYCLFQVLSFPHVWMDFSNVDMQIQLGQILWGSTKNVNGSYNLSPTVSNTEDVSSTKYWLLLQVLLGCEMLLRLDALIYHNSSNPAAGFKNLKIKWTKGVKYTLFLAKAWLKNICIVEKADQNDYSVKSQPFHTSSQKFEWSTFPEAFGQSFSQIGFQGRHQIRQLTGLMRFAQAIKWPEWEKLEANAISITSATISALDSSTVVSTRSLSSSSLLEPLSIKPFSSSHKSSKLDVGKWISEAYFNGLILPGETFIHALLLTLVQNDERALSKLGSLEDLKGGLIYSGRSFWRSACIVGKVLASSEGASECMGWVSSSVLPRGIDEGWLDVDAKPRSLDQFKKIGTSPRIWHATTIENHSNVIAGADISSVLTGDFAQPSDQLAATYVDVNFKSLYLLPSRDSVRSSTRNRLEGTLNYTVTGTEKSQPLTPLMRFTYERAGATPKTLEIELNYNVQFVTAHPCISPPNTGILSSPTNPAFQSPTLGTPKIPNISSGHPLHKAYTYTKIPLSHLLGTHSSARFSSLLTVPVSSDPSQSSLHTTSSSIPRVLVIDCTEQQLRPRSSLDGDGYGSHVEMIARAICAERGWNALVSRRGRGCLACSIREAGALGWRVIIRVA